MTITRFFLLRHAPTEWNAQGRIQGRDDSPLTAEGEALAEAWGRALAGRGIDRMLVSDLGRTRATAERVNRCVKIPLALDARLQEQDWGRWTGRRREEIVANDPDFAVQAERGWRFRAPGGESRLQVYGRAAAALSEAAARHPGEDVLVVTHEGVIRVLTYRLSGRLYYSYEPKLLEDRRLHEIVAAGGGFSLGRLNEALSP